MTDCVENLQPQVEAMPSQRRAWVFVGPLHRDPRFQAILKKMGLPYPPPGAPTQ